MARRASDSVQGCAWAWSATRTRGEQDAKHTAAQAVPFFATITVVHTGGLNSGRLLLLDAATSPPQSCGAAAGSATAPPRTTLGADGVSAARPAPTATEPTYAFVFPPISYLLTSYLPPYLLTFYLPRVAPSSRARSIVKTPLASALSRLSAPLCSHKLNLKGLWTECAPESSAATRGGRRARRRPDGHWNSVECRI